MSDKTTTRKVASSSPFDRTSSIPLKVLVHEEGNKNKKLKLEEWNIDEIFKEFSETECKKDPLTYVWEYEHTVLNGCKSSQDVLDKTIMHFQDIARTTRACIRICSGNLLHFASVNCSVASSELRIFNNLNHECNITHARNSDTIVYDQDQSSGGLNPGTDRGSLLSIPLGTIAKETNSNQEFRKPLLQFTTCDFNNEKYFSRYTIAILRILFERCQVEYMSWLHAEDKITEALRIQSSRVNTLDHTLLTQLAKMTAAFPFHDQATVVLKTNERSEAINLTRYKRIQRSWAIADAGIEKCIEADEFKSNVLKSVDLSVYRPCILFKKDSTIHATNCTKDEGEKGRDFNLGIPGSEKWPDQLNVLLLPISELPNCDKGILWIERRNAGFTRDDIKAFNQKLDAESINIFHRSTANAIDRRRMFFICPSSSNEKTERLLTDIERAIELPYLPVLIRGESGVGKSLLSLHIHNNSLPLNEVRATSLPPEYHLWSPNLPWPTMLQKYKDPDRSVTLVLDHLERAGANFDIELEQLLDQLCDIHKADPHHPFRIIGIVEESGRSGDAGLVSKISDLFSERGVEILIPPLRDRLEEIPDLVQYWLSCTDLATQFPNYHLVDEMVFSALRGVDWKQGNLRSLRAVLTKMCLNASRPSTAGETIYLTLEDLEKCGDARFTPSLRSTPEQRDKERRQKEMEVLKLHQDGLSFEEIGRRFGFSRTSAQNYYLRAKQRVQSSSTQEGKNDNTL